MKINPISDKEYQESRSFSVWPVGDYPCEIIKCTEKQSKSGNNMFECLVKVFNDKGHSTNIFSYLIADGKAAWTLRSAAEAFGMLEQYKSGEISDVELLGATAYAHVVIKKADGQYPEKNIIQYFKAGDSELKQAKQNVSGKKLSSFDDLDDDIPL